jgi:hypothetical protein
MEVKALFDMFEAPQPSQIDNRRWSITIKARLSSDLNPLVVAKRTLSEDLI